MSSPAFTQLQSFLKDMFQFDDHDLDFGIYRIIRLKRSFIQHFIDGDDQDSLQATVQQALSQVQHSSGETARNWLSAFSAQFGERGKSLWNPLSENPKDPRARQEFEKLLELAEESDREQALKHLETLVEAGKLSLSDLEGRVYNHLLNFFELYYKNGDFGYNTRAAKTFKIPYEADYDGSDTMFHWKHKDSYYIKTGNGFRSVRCQVNGAWLEFRMQSSGEGQASTARNNLKEDSAKQYRLEDIQPVEETDPDGTTRTIWHVLLSLASEATPKVEIYQRIWKVVFADGTDLTPYLHKKPDKKEEVPGKPIFNDLTANHDQVQGGQVKGISQLRLKDETYFSELAKREEFKDLGANAAARCEALGKDPVACGLYLLDRRLNTFYAGNDADFFIHKDLQGFLNKEKERYIKNVIFSDVKGLLKAGQETTTLQVARAFNQVADRLIAFLDTIETFQKDLFEMKKKVVNTHYLISVGRIPTDFYPRLLANEKQLAEWRDVYNVEVKTPEELNEHPSLVVDTSLYTDADPKLQDDLLSHPAFDNLDEQTDGLLINSENWQALNLLQEKFREQVKCIYIDPPYNTGGDGFLYKDAFRHSSWAAMMADRLKQAYSYLGMNGILFASIDYRERCVLEHLLNNSFGFDNRVEELVWAQNTNDNRAPAYSTNHEYIMVYAKNKTAATSSSSSFREKRPGYAELIELVRNMEADYPSIKDVELAIKALMEQHRNEFKKELQQVGLSYDKQTKKQDPWRGVYNYKHLEYRDNKGRYVNPEDAEKVKATLWIWREADSSAPPKDDARNITDPKDPNYRFYRPIHPVTGKPCKTPNGGWRLRYHPDIADSAKDSFVAREKDNRIVWGKDEKKIPQLKRFLHEAGNSQGDSEDSGLFVPKSVFYDYTDGAKQIESLFGGKGVFRFPKPNTLMQKFFEQTTTGGDWVVDFFVGSGTTAHAFLNLNKEYGNNQKRKLLVVDMEKYVNTVVKERVKRVMFSVNWKNGKPVNENGLQHLIKIQTLEQYEDLLDNLQTSWDEKGLPEHTPVQYLYMPERNELASSLDLSRPFAQTMRIGKKQEVVSIDLMETWCYLQGYWMKSKRIFREFDRIYQAVETTRNKLILFRDIAIGEDDTDTIRTILQSYKEQGDSPGIFQLEVNHEIDRRNIEIPVHVVTADDFLGRTLWN